MAKNVWNYRGHKLQQIEWGLWKDTCCRGRYFLCYRPRGRKGPVIRRWAELTEYFTLEELQDHVRDVHAAVNRNKAGLNEPAHVSCIKAQNDYIAELTRLGRHARHLQDVKSALSNFVDFEYQTECKLSALQEIHPEHIEEYLQKLAKGSESKHGISPRTQNKIRGHIAAWLTWCKKRQLVDSNAAEQVGRVREKSKHHEFPSVDQMKTLVDVSDSYDAACWAFLSFSGLRRASFLSLNSDCFQDDRIIVPHTKRQTAWQILLADGCPLWGQDLSLLGAAIWKARVPTPDYLRFRLEQSCKLAGFRVTAHGFRHAFCSWLAMMGENRQDIAAWAHHSAPKTTDRYLHLRPRGSERISENRQSVFDMRSHVLEKIRGGLNF